MVLAAYVLIRFWQFRNACAISPGPGCYKVRDPLDLALVAAAATGACIGFLWWNAAPGQIFMGDTGSLALGGLIAGLSRDQPHRAAARRDRRRVRGGGRCPSSSRSSCSAPRGRRLFRMAPFHHHFELAGWAETTVIVRFWLLAAIACGARSGALLQRVARPRSGL